MKRGGSSLRGDVAESKTDHQAYFANKKPAGGKLSGFIEMEMRRWLSLPSDDELSLLGESTNLEGEAALHAAGGVLVEHLGLGGFVSG